MFRAANAVALDVYCETQDFYRDRAAALYKAACGFRILYGPPFVDAPIVFVGFNPGGDASDIEEEHHLRWPDKCDYAVQDWKLAKRMREIWSIEVLARSTGLNSLFFRSPSIKAWEQVPVELRREMEEFSSAQFRKLIETLAPKRIVFIGFRQFDRFVEDSSEALRMDGRLLIKSGRVWGMRADGVIHLTGARISGGHIAAIKAFFGS